MKGSEEDKVPCPKCGGKATRKHRESGRFRYVLTQCRCGYTHTTVATLGEGDLIDSLLQERPDLKSN